MIEKQSKPKPARKSGAPSQLFHWEFDKWNLIIVAAAIVVILLGYVFLGIGPHDSDQSRTIAPLLLVAGYMIILPIGILWRSR